MLEKAGNIVHLLLGLILSPIIKLNKTVRKLAPRNARIRTLSALLMNHRLRIIDLNSD